MADIGMDVDGLRIKVLEVEVLIEEKRFAQKRIMLEQEKIRVRDRQYTQSLRDIDAQIETHITDCASLREALEAATEGKRDG